MADDNMKVWKDFDLTNFLSDIDMFNKLSKNQLQHIADACTLKPLHKEPDTYIVQQGKEAPGIFFLVAGQVQLMRRALPDVVDWGVWHHRVVEPKELWGEIETALDEHTALTTAWPKKIPVQVFLIERENLWRLMREDSDIAACILRRVALRFQERMSDLTEFRMLSARQRLCLYMLRNGQEPGKDVCLTNEQFSEIIGATIGNVQKYISELSGGVKKNHTTGKDDAPAYISRKIENGIRRLHVTDENGLISRMRNDTRERTRVADEADP